MPKLPSLRANSYSITVERLRRTLPLDTLLKMKALAALTGQLPIMDVNGVPTGQFDALDTDQRLKAIDGLIDKAMPDRQEAPLLPEDTRSEKVQDVRNLSDEELEALASVECAKPAELIGDSGTGPSVPDSPSAPGTPASSSDEGTPAA